MYSESASALRLVLRLVARVCTDQWDVQATIIKIVRELQRRQYLVWVDCEYCTVHPITL
jgi:hypothetical protein